jgi:hypothetical protein
MSRSSLSTSSCEARVTSNRVDDIFAAVSASGSGETCGGFQCGFV